MDFLKRVWNHFYPRVRAMIVVAVLMLAVGILDLVANDTQFIEMLGPYGPFIATALGAAAGWLRKPVNELE